MARNLEILVGPEKYMTSYLHEIQSNIIDLCSDSAWLKKDGQHFYRPHGTIFRGEEECYPHVSSTLYRHLEETVPKWKEWKDGDREAKILECEHSFGPFLGERYLFLGIPAIHWQESMLAGNRRRSTTQRIASWISMSLYFLRVILQREETVALYFITKNKNMPDVFFQKLLTVTTIKAGLLFL